MRNKIKKDTKITHILADGSNLDSIKGHVIPAGHPFYETYANIIKKIHKEKSPS